MANIGGLIGAEYGAPSKYIWFIPVSLALVPNYLKTGAEYFSSPGRSQLRFAS
jgi:hypothetical protein